jgi:hypothetical protein
MVITILLRKLNAEDHLAKPDGIILRWKNTILFIILFDLLYIFLNELVYNSHNLRNLVIISIIIATS